MPAAFGSGVGSDKLFVLADGEAHDDWRRDRYLAFLVVTASAVDDGIPATVECALPTHCGRAEKELRPLLAASVSAFMTKGPSPLWRHAVTAGSEIAQEQERIGILCVRQRSPAFNDRQEIVLDGVSFQSPTLP